MVTSFNYLAKVILFKSLLEKVKQSFQYCKCFTLMCLSIGTPKSAFIGTPKTVNFPFVPNGKLMFLDVPILKHTRVLHYSEFIYHYLINFMEH